MGRNELTRGKFSCVFEKLEKNSSLIETVSKATSKGLKSIEKHPNLRKQETSHFVPTWALSTHQKLFEGILVVFDLISHVFFF